jgi:hypothetical protein
MNFHTHSPYIGAPQQLAFQRAKDTNMSHMCKARGCTQHRESLGAYCHTHNLRYRRFGHPNARPIKPLQYRPYRKLVNDLLEANKDHPGMVAALGYVEKYMQQSAADEASSKGAPEVARVARHGVSPKEVLIEVCAFWCWLQDHPRSLPDTKAEDFAISRAVMAMAPRPRRISREAALKGTAGYPMRAKFSALNAIGTHLRSVLAFFLANVAEAVATRDVRAKETLQALRAPLASPITVFLAEAAKAKPAQQEGKP